MIAIYTLETESQPIRPSADLTVASLIAYLYIPYVIYLYTCSDFSFSETKLKNKRPLRRTFTNLFITTCV